MKKSFLLSVLFLLLLSIFSCATRKNPSITGDASVSEEGCSFENAVVVPETTEFKGIDWEYAYLEKKYPGCQKLGQSLVFEGNKPYDIITIKTEDGRELKVYFDISNFFGKFE